MLVVKALLWLTSFVPYVVCLRCNSDYGPSGINECFKLSSYNDEYQYKTCLTNTYIQLKSNMTTGCRETSNGTVTEYCWYHCMDELHDISKGLVYNDCKCYPTYKISIGLLSGGCYSPSGNDCSWFKDCLQNKYPCHEKTYNDMIQLAYVLCNLNGNIGKVLSEKTIRWLTSASKCFQIQMTPVLKPWLYFNCSTIDKKATVVQETCLSHPMDPFSICDIIPNEFWYIFWAIREKFETNFVPSLETFANLAQSCPFKNTSTLRTLKLKFADTVEITQQIAEKTFSVIQKKMQWKINGLMWYAKFDRKESELLILLGVQQYLNIELSDRDEEKLVDNAIVKFANAFDNKTFQFSIDDEIIQLSSMFVCSDLFQCNRTYLHKNATYTDISLGYQERKGNADIIGYTLIAVVGGVVFLYSLCYLFGLKKGRFYIRYSKKRPR